MFEEPAIAPCVDIVPASGHGLPWFVSIAFVAVVGASSSVWLRTVLALNETVSYRPVGCEALEYARDNGMIDTFLSKIEKDRFRARSLLHGSPGAFDVSCGSRKAAGRSRKLPDFGHRRTAAPSVAVLTRTSADRSGD